MDTLKDYSIPEAILNIKPRLTKDEIAALVKESTALESNVDNYVKAFTKMLHFEEAAERHAIVQFNTKNIRLKQINEREYCIYNDVNAILSIVV